LPLRGLWNSLSSNGRTDVDTGLENCSRRKAAGRKIMKTGVWIDHREAILVGLDGERDSTRVIVSGADKHVRLAGGSRSVAPWGPQDVAKEASRDRKLEQQLDRYYDEVAAGLRDAEAIFLCGPGEAKTELRKRLEGTKVESRIVAVEAADKMTKRRLAAKVRSVFGEERAGARR
jgi:hypothetical protein